MGFKTNNEGGENMFQGNIIDEEDFESNLNSNITFVNILKAVKGIGNVQDFGKFEIWSKC
jgi:hypothetical protein